jgi:hemerythrin-like metal-binding protein
MMTLIPWRKEFETGIPDVDHEHFELVALLNRLHDEVEAEADGQRIGDFLGEVFAKIASHFALEEAVMRDRQYDEYEAHKAEHERLLDEIRDIMDAVANGAVEDYRTALSETVRDWFVGHFQTKDARLHRKLGV